MRVAICGKGGSGKTTLAALLCRSLGARGYRVLAIDGDPNPNLAMALGLEPERLAALKPLPRDLLTEVREGEARRHVLRLPPAEVVRQFGTEVAEGLTLLVGTRVDHAGKG
jgi:CO dehydrogenase maturation factor